MAWFQAPTDGQIHPESHLHAEFYPYRTRDRLKYLAGTELAGYVCERRASLREKAKELQAVSVTSINFVMNQLNEFPKLELIRRALNETGAHGLLLRGTDWFAWAAAGAENTVLLTAETGWQKCW